MNSTVFMPKEDNASVEQALAFKELARRLDLPVTFVIENFATLSEVILWKPTKEVQYP